MAGFLIVDHVSDHEDAHLLVEKSPLSRDSRLQERVIDSEVKRTL
jgi:hypothetical protein